MTIRFDVTVLIITSYNAIATKYTTNVVKFPSCFSTRPELVVRPKLRCYGGAGYRRTLQIASLVGSRERYFSQWFKHDRHVMASCFIFGQANCCNSDRFFTLQYTLNSFYQPYEERDYPGWPKFAAIKTTSGFPKILQVVPGLRIRVCRFVCDPAAEYVHS